jgi:hypothetical protein
LNGIGVIHGRKCDGEEVEKRIEVHSSNEGDEERGSHNFLTSEKLSWNHGEFGEFPFPDDPADNQDKTNEKGGEDVCSCPGMGVTS